MFSPSTLEIIGFFYCPNGCSDKLILWAIFTVFTGVFISIADIAILLFRKSFGQIHGKLFGCAGSFKQSH